MKARTRVVVAPPDRLAHLECHPPLTIRPIHHDGIDCALCLVGRAAGPLAGDDLELNITVQAGAAASLIASGASLAQGAGGTRTLRTRLTVEDRARLVGRPQPVISAAESRTDLTVDIDLGHDAAVEWHELLVLGRSGEPAGAITLRWNVIRQGRPVLRQFIDLADPTLTSWPGMTGRHRVQASILVADPARKAQTVVHAPTAVAARLDEHTMLLTVFGDDTATVARSAGALLAAVN